MTSSTAQTRRIGLELQRTELYPPLLDTGGALVRFFTALPESESADFTYLLNGQPGSVPGISIMANPRDGMLMFQAAFMQSYSGPWPAALEVQASQNGSITDTATLRLLDTRTVVVARIEASLDPNPAIVVAGETVAIEAHVSFHDAQGVEVPHKEVAWDIQVANGSVGVVADGQRLLLDDRAEPGTFVTSIRVPTGLKHPVRLVVEPRQDPGLDLSRYDLYPPIMSGPTKVWITHSLPQSELESLRYTLNDESTDSQPGIHFEGAPPGLGWVFTQAFAEHYPGPWPARLRVFARINGQELSTRVLRLHDTRNAVCVRMDAILRPSDTVTIPATGAELVAVTGLFYDPDDILIPHQEVPSDLVFIDPMEGVEEGAEMIAVLPHAKPGSYRLELVGPGELKAGVVLKLI